MWLAETAVDTATLEDLAAAGIRYTVLAPHQAEAVRPLDSDAWSELHGDVDATRPYLCRLPSGQEIVLFFYNGGLSRAIAFEGALRNGADLLAPCPRRLRNSAAFRDGLVELQDAASQAVVEALPLAPGQRVLDYCAGGGGKTLAIGAGAEVTLFAHDAAPRRMRDLPERAARAGLSVTLLEGPELARAAPFDLVLCDVPCSGSGAWRRAPEGKWRLTEAALEAVIETQAEILDRAAGLVAPGGILAYATCSMLTRENGGQIEAFLARHPDWRCTWQRSWPVTGGADGFFSAQLTRAAEGA